MKFEDIDIIDHEGIVEKKVEIIFHIREKTPYGNYNDSLYYSFADWAALTEVDLAAAVTARVDKWIAVVTNPPPPRVPTEEELINAKEYVLEQLRQVNAQKDELYPPKPVSEMTEEEKAELRAQYEAEIAAAQAKLDSLGVVR